MQVMDFQGYIQIRKNNVVFFFNQEYWSIFLYYLPDCLYLSLLLFQLVLQPVSSWEESSRNAAIPV